MRHLRDASSRLLGPNVRFGSKADICSAQTYVRLTPIATTKADLRNTMSALPPKADMCSALVNVRFVPIADMRSARKLRRFLSSTRRVAISRNRFFWRSFHHGYGNCAAISSSPWCRWGTGNSKAFALTNRYRVRLIDSGMARQLGMIMAWPVAAREGALIGYGPTMWTCFAASVRTFFVSSRVRRRGTFPSGAHKVSIVDQR